MYVRLEFLYQQMNKHSYGKKKIFTFALFRLQHHMTELFGRTFIHNSWSVYYVSILFPR
jgi:cell division FtsZ-interacting protein ZapD